MTPDPATATIGRFTHEYRFLSNFWPAPVDLDGMTYPTVEHAYQAAKTLDPNEREWVRLAITPGDAKRRGRRVTVSADWESRKLQVMEDLLRQKFDPSRDQLYKMLLGTRGRGLVEGNDWGDTFWGVCRGEGQNHLGRLLMKIRDEGAG